MLDNIDDAGDSTFTLAFPTSPRTDAATDIFIRVDDGADIVFDVRGGDGRHINAYLTVDQAEELIGVLSEIVKMPGDRTGAVVQDPADAPKGR